MIYDPHRHFWIADDGRVFNGAKQVVTTDADADYVAWTEAGYVPTIWPYDSAGEQTEAELQTALGPFSMFVNLTYYTADARRRRYASDVTVNGLPFSTDPVSLGGLNAAMLYTADKDIESFSWKLPDGSFITLTAAQIKDLQSVVAAFGQSCFVCEDDTLTAIENGAITTRQEIDAAFAAISNVFTSAGTFTVRHGPRK